MGYDTTFKGRFKLNKILDPGTHEFLTKLANTRRMKRNVDSMYGVEGEFYVKGTGYMGQDHEPNIVNYNGSPRTQPGLWCKWIPSQDGQYIEWDGSEKFYSYIEWIEYIMEKILAPKGYLLSGVVQWIGENRGDIGTMQAIGISLLVERGVHKDCIRAVSVDVILELEKE